MNTRKKVTNFPAGNFQELISPYRGRLTAGLVMMVVLVVAGTTVFVAGQAANHVSASSEPSAQVTIARSGISPETVSIKVGQSVTWTNTDAQSHRLELVNTGSGVPAIGFGGDEAVGRGETYSYAFSRAGTYTYTDATNPGQVRGFVIVKP